MWALMMRWMRVVRTPVWARTRVYGEGEEEQEGEEEEEEEQEEGRKEDMKPGLTSRRWLKSLSRVGYGGCCNVAV